MKKINISFLFPLIALVLLVSALSTQMFGIFPLGKALDPFIGIVQNKEDNGLAASVLTLEKMGLSDSVSVFFDNRKVPHIYAKNEHDVYFTQGYVTARLRLWQMDFLTYVSAGRLSEVFNDGFLEYDRTQRRMGILKAARSALALIEKDPETNKVLTAYTEGVNAYIKQLDYKSMPLEYKLMDFEPEPWSKLKTVLIMKYMGTTLSGYDQDLSMSEMMLAIGEDNFNKLFPDFTFPAAPMIADSASHPNPALCHINKPGYLDYSFLSSNTVVKESLFNPRLGSNSWAVSGKKTRSGFPILCNDPHLNFSLPSIWIEMQLSYPGMNVYGVSIPGTPAIIIGFNKDIAWGLTNGEDDIKDWYKLKITPDYKKYELNGKWINLDFTIEDINIRNRKTFRDTIYYTLHGPIVSDDNFPGQRPELKNYALRWEVQNPSNEFLTFIKLNSAHNYADYKEAIKHYSSPIQNFTFACKDNTIAVSHQGSMAIKSPGQGKFVLDGTDSKQLPDRYIPQDSLPHTVNPSCNYVLSANQHPTNTTYPYYYNGSFTESRANRIRQILEKDNGFDIDKMKSMQLDNTNSFAVEALPVLMGMINKEELTGDQKKDLEFLSTWKGTYDRDDEHPKLFEFWWKNIEELTWDEFAAFTFYRIPPSNYALLNLIRTDPLNIYFDRQSTSQRENATDIIRQAFIDASTGYNMLKAKTSVKWGDCNKVNIMHLTNLRAFSTTDIPSAGCPDAINATSPAWGPSWRMIVELGDRPRAFGIFAGGQSGNAGSLYYDNFITDWTKGNYYPLQFFMSAAEAKGQAINTWTLK